MQKYKWGTTYPPCGWHYIGFALSNHQTSECVQKIIKKKNHLEYRYPSTHVVRQLPVQLSLSKMGVISSLFLVLPDKQAATFYPSQSFCENVQIALDARFYFPKEGHYLVIPQSCAEVGHFLGLVFHSSIIPCLCKQYSIPSPSPFFSALQPYPLPLTCSGLCQVLCRSL